MSVELATRLPWASVSKAAIAAMGPKISSRMTRARGTSASTRPAQRRCPRPSEARPGTATRRRRRRARPAPGDARPTGPRSSGDDVGLGLGGVAGAERRHALGEAGRQSLGDRPLDVGLDDRGAAPPPRCGTWRRRRPRRPRRGRRRRRRTPGRCQPGSAVAGGPAGGQAHRWAPTRGEPVKVSLRRRGSASSGSVAAGSLQATTVRQPSGRPASVSASAAGDGRSGAASLARRTTVQAGSGQRRADPAGRHHQGEVPGRDDQAGPTACGAQRIGATLGVAVDPARDPHGLLGFHSRYSAAKATSSAASARRLARLASVSAKRSMSSGGDGGAAGGHAGAPHAGVADHAAKARWRRRAPPGRRAGPRRARRRWRRRCRGAPPQAPSPPAPARERRPEGRGVGGDAGSCPRGARHLHGARLASRHGPVGPERGRLLHARSWVSTGEGSMCPPRGGATTRGGSASPARPRLGS